MKHISFDTAKSFDIAILINEDYLSKNELLKYYINECDIPAKSFIAFGLPPKATTKQAKQNLSKLLPYLHNMGVKLLYICDSTHFKAITKSRTADSSIGYVKDCSIKGLEHIKVIYGINYGQLKYNPNVLNRLSLSLKTLSDYYNGTYNEIGTDIIKKSIYPNTDDEIQLFLNQLKRYPILTCDIETTGLKVGSELYSIAFAWSCNEGGSFKVTNKQVLKNFFEEYKGHLIFHNATFDIKHIIFNCFMKHPTDMYGLLHGLNTLTKKLHDTKIIAYLSTNSTAGNELGLKYLSHEFVGNYAVDVSDVTSIPLADLLRYNLIDVLATWFVFNKYYPVMLQDNQLNIYETMMLPSLKTIIQMELIGLPMDLNRVIEVEKQLNQKAKIANNVIDNICTSLGIHDKLRQIELDKLNAELKTKVKTLDDVSDYFFNPNSNKHLQYVLYTHFGLPVINYTKTKQPSTDADTVNDLINHTTDQTVIKFLNALITLGGISKILSSFIPAFKQAMQKDNHHYLMGNFNLGGTLSGRLSSNNP